MTPTEMRKLITYHLTESERVQKEVAEREARAMSQTSNHWPLQQRLLKDPDNWAYQKAVGLRNYHQRMVEVYSQALTALSITTFLEAATYPVRWADAEGQPLPPPPPYAPPGPRSPEPPDTRTPGS